jgi:hypothetical protein
MRAHAPLLSSSKLYKYGLTVYLLALDKKKKVVTGKIGRPLYLEMASLSKVVMCRKRNGPNMHFVMPVLATHEATG